MKIISLLLLFASSSVVECEEKPMTVMAKLSVFLVSERVVSLSSEDLRSLTIEVAKGGTGPVPFPLRPDAQIIQIWPGEGEISQMIYIQIKEALSVKDFTEKLLSSPSEIKSIICDYSILHIGE